MTAKEILWEKIKLVYASLRRQGHWYTGLSIKRFLKKEIFKLQSPQFNNSAVNSGRWSAYCHYSILKSFQNLLDKNQIGSGSKILVNPLLPNFVIEELLSRKVQIFALDIDKNTLNFDSKQLQTLLLENQNQQFDLVIHYGFNGIYEPITECLNLQYPLVIPSIVLIDNPDINLALLNLFESLSLGGILWSFGDSFWDDQLDTVLDVDLKSHSWFVSWQIENRTSSILEHHLTESHYIFLPLLQAFFYLLLNKYQEFDFLGKIYKFTASRFLLKKQFTTSEAAMEAIKVNYEKLYDSALPDLVFDLQIKTPVNSRSFSSAKQLVEQNLILQTETKNLYNMFLQAVNSMEKGSLEIPSFFLDKTYLKFCVFTTDQSHWYAQIQPKGYLVETFPPIHEFLTTNFNLPNANFVTQYGLLIDVMSLIKATA